jgi:NAD(P)-dependent dehydrogenase (short-subunit alcohol dehydrogenase family)
VGKEGPLELAKFMRVINVNLVGTFNMSSNAAVFMARNEPEAAERGVIVNVASIAAYDGQVGQCAYAAAKGGIAAMTLPLARDLSRDGIRVNTIAPGIIDTPMMAKMSEPARQALSTQVLFPSRLGFPDEFAMLAEQLVLNGYINGECIRLDGGIRMQPK